MTLAAALPELEYDCGLGTGALFAADVADLSPVDGSIPVGRVTPDAARLNRLAASACAAATPCSQHPTAERRPRQRTPERPAPTRETRVAA